ncbi:MAG: hypothetical protein BWK79_00480 [Beggiatoa sp. IS2]|nr:MAG: hypothetical protein BWK79_00480 [Beggiatoa sp. IS2]
MTFLAYQETLLGTFLNWDDLNYVVRNPHIKNWENVGWIFTFYEGNWTPLSWLSHALAYTVFGLDPWGHHLINVILHCVNTVLVFVLATILFKLSTTTKFTLLAASLTALLFGLHPQHVEAVAWISARKDVLSLFFILLTLLSYLLYYAARTVKIRFFTYVIALLSFTLALMAKPTAMMLPFILLLLDSYLLKSTPTRRLYRDILLEKIPFLLLSLTVASFAWIAQQQSDTFTSVGVFTTTERLANAAQNAFFYPAKWLLPTAFLPIYPLSREFHLIPIAMTLLITVLCGYAWYKKHFVWLLSWLSYLLAVAPVLGIVQFGGHAAADRFAYFPTLPFYFLAGASVTILSIKPYQQILRAGFAIAVLLITIFLFQMTKAQNFIWNNDLTLWQYTVAFSPDNAIAQANLGSAYLQRGENELALSHYQQALAESAKKRLFYDVGRLYFQIGIAHLKLSHWSDALYHFNYLLVYALDSGQDQEVVLYYVGFIYAEQGLLVPARMALSIALTLNPNHAPSQKLLNNIKSLN